MNPSNAAIRLTVGGLRKGGLYRLLYSQTALFAPATLIAMANGGYWLKFPCPYPAILFLSPESASAAILLEWLIQRKQNHED